MITTTRQARKARELAYHHIRVQNDMARQQISFWYRRSFGPHANNKAVQSVYDAYQAASRFKNVSAREAGDIIAALGEAARAPMPFRPRRQNPAIRRTASRARP